MEIWAPDEFSDKPEGVAQRFRGGLKDWDFATNSNFPILESLKPDVLDF